MAWLASQDELLGVFMGSTGVSVDELRANAENPEFLGSVLEFLLMDDAWVVAFCDAHALAYDVPMRARQSLPGGNEVHWT